MKTLTLFRAYRAVRNIKDNLVSARGGRVGIMVTTDMYAVEYQRKDRLQQKLERKIIERLSGNERD